MSHHFPLNELYLLCLPQRFIPFCAYLLNYLAQFGIFFDFQNIFQKLFVELINANFTYFIDIILHHVYIIVTSIYSYFSSRDIANLMRLIVYLLGTYPVIY